MDIPALGRRHAFLAFLAYLAFVVYGSLIPFDYRHLTLDEALNAFASIRYLNLGVASRADWVANLVLYVPLAFLGCVWMAGMRPAGAARYLTPVAVFALCLAVAVAVEFTQLFFAPRTVSLNDLLAEGLGTLVGIALWGFGRWRIAGLWVAFAAGGRSSVLAVLVAYGLLYVALSLFPYDVLVSARELSWKLDSGNWGWLLAGSCAAGWLRCGARLAGEALAIAPLGLLIALVAPTVRYRQVFGAGLALGLALELLQFLLASGVSQGLSAVLRGVGLVGGLALGRRLHRSGPMPMARLAWRAIPFVALPYVLLVAALAGWFAAPWLPVGEALARLADVRFLPFYYHYFSTEPAAMASLLANAGLYAPVGLAWWVWRAARGAPGRRRAWSASPALWAALLALVIEFGKLWVPGKHPDFTNVLIAATSAACIHALARWIEQVLIGDRSRPAGRETPAAAVPKMRSVGEGTPFPPRAVATVRSPLSPAGEGLGVRVAEATPDPLTPALSPMKGREGVERLRAVLVGGGAALGALVGVMHYPVGALWLGLALLGYGVLLWRRPTLWLFVVPALLPVLDLSPFTGRLLLDEFDGLVLVTLAVGYWRVRGIQPLPWPHRGVPVAVALLWLTWMVATARGLWPLLGWEGGLADSSHSPLEAWVAGKGLLWALLLLPLMRRVPLAEREEARRGFLNGLVVGLVVVILVVLWERHVFVGLGDFEDVFRVTGTFSSMQNGGAYIEAFIAFAFPALAVWVLRPRHWALMLAGLLAVALAGYAMLVTFSRGGYAGLVVGLAVVAWVMLRPQVGALRRRGLVLAGLTAALVAVAVPVLSGGFAQDRLARAVADFNFRVTHWERALGLMDDGATTALIGMGFGQYPVRYLLAADVARPPGTFSVRRDGDHPYLRLGAGEAAFLDQWVRIRPGEQYTLSARVRQAYGGGTLSVPLCEKALLYSFECSWQRFDPEALGGAWSTVTVEVETGRLGSGGNWPHRPVKLSLHNSGSGGAVDVDKISLQAADGRELLANGDFSAGVKRWLFVTDQRLAWHIDQQWVETYFAQGLLGVVALVVLLIAVARALWPSLRAGNSEAVALAAGLAGFLTVGLLGSTLDTARVATLLYLGACCGGVLQSHSK